MIAKLEGEPDIIYVQVPFIETSKIEELITKVNTT